jgi:hypothetical protein
MRINRLIIGLIILTLFSCSNQSKKKGKDSNIDTINNGNIVQQIPRDVTTLDTFKQGGKLFINDTTKYSLYFINQLKSVCGPNDYIRIIDDSLFLYQGKFQNQDKVFLIKYKIPTELELNQETVYVTKLNENSYTLILQRTNYTDIEYKLKRANEIIKSGNALLQGTFILGAEGQENEKGDAMFLHQYLDTSKCGAIIKVEFYTAERATILYCDNESYLELPILIKK